MKKSVFRHTLRAALLFAAAAILCIVQISCSSSSENDFTFVKKGDGYALLSMKRRSNVVRVPASYEGLPVTEISENAFSSDLQLIEISIPASVREIDAFAFSSCAHLEKVVFAENGSCAIGDHAFENCASLAVVDFASSVYSIGGGAFLNCARLGTIKDDGTLLQIGVDAFKNCEKLKIRAPEGSYAALYAASHHIETSAVSSSALLYAVGIGSGVAVGVLAVWITSRIGKRSKNKKTDKNS